MFQTLSQRVADAEDESRSEDCDDVPAAVEGWAVLRVHGATF